MHSFFERLRFVKPVRKLVYVLIGTFTYPALVWKNKLSISGTENIKNLPKKNVLFVSNHQTYFMDVITFLHVFCAVKWGKKDKLGVPYYLLNPFSNVYFVSAEDTMKKTVMSRLLSLAGAITVKRTWVDEDKSVRKGLNISDSKNILKVLSSSWVITFPQGTTTPYAPGRKGTAFLVKQSKCTVIPIVIDGFSTAFHRKGITVRKKGTPLSVRIKPAMDIDYSQSMDEILQQIMVEIEQDKSRSGREEKCL